MSKASVFILEWQMFDGNTPSLIAFVSRDDRKHRKSWMGEVNVIGDRIGSLY
jgi:hypothetical protein